MAKKKNAAVEGEEHASAPVEDQATEEVSEATPQDGDNPPVEEAAPAEEIPAEAVGPSEVTTIKLLTKSAIRGANRQIKSGETGEVVTSIADALVGRGQAEYVD